MKAKYFAVLCFCIFWIVVIFLASWLDRVPVNAQEKGEYPQQSMSLSINTETIDQDSVLVLFSTRGLLGLLKEYQAYCDTVHYEIDAVEKTFRPWGGWKDYRDSIKTVIVQGKYSDLNGFIDWLENVKLKK